MIFADISKLIDIKMYYLTSISLGVCIVNVLVLESLSSQASYHTVPGVLAFSGCTSSMDKLISENANSPLCFLRHVTALLSVTKCS